jgi:hypothetical protein
MNNRYPTNNSGNMQSSFGYCKPNHSFEKQTVSKQIQPT